MMVLGAIVAVIATDALGVESELGLSINQAARVRDSTLHLTSAAPSTQWGAVTGIIAGASSPLVGVAVQVAVERALGTIAAAWLGCGVFLVSIDAFPYYCYVPCYCYFPCYSKM